MPNKSMDPNGPIESPFPDAAPWNVVAEGYGDVIKPMSEYFAREALNLAALPAGAQIVDVAAGPGLLSVLAAQAGAKINAIDFSPAMVANLRRRAAQLGIEIEDLRVGDGQNLPYEDESFDGAFSLLGLIFFPDRAAGFMELHRVLRPGRRAVVSSMAALSDPYLTAMDALRAVLPEIPQAKEAPLSDPESFIREMSAAGYTEVTIHTIEYPETSPSLLDFWSKVECGSAGVVVLQRKLGERRWGEVSQAVLSLLQEALGDGPIEEVYTNHFGVGVK